MKYVEKNDDLTNYSIMIDKRSSTEQKCFGKFNKAIIRGVLEQNFEFCYRTGEELFYKSTIQVQNVKCEYESIQIVINYSVLNQINSWTNLKGSLVEVEGQIRSFQIQKGKYPLKIFVYAKALKVYKNEIPKPIYLNLVYLAGRIKGQPVQTISYHKDYKTDIFITVRRGIRNKLDYIPCVIWTAEQENWLQDLVDGVDIELYGNFRQRQYFKKIPDHPAGGQYRKAYEIQANHIKIVNSQK